MSLDAILQLRHGDNEELRYAARSWSANLPHRRLVVAGGRPDWLTGVDHTPVPEDARKHLHAWENLRRLMSRRDLTDDVILLMDDTFVMEPLAEVPMLHRGPVADVVAEYEARWPSSPYTRMMRETLTLLAGWGCPEPLSYELHTPMVLNRRLLLDLMNRLERELWHWPKLNIARSHWRTIYGACHVENALRSDDVKIYDLEDRFSWPTPFLSTDDTSFADGAVGRHIRAAFPDPCDYEAR